MDAIAGGVFDLPEELSAVRIDANEEIGRFRQEQPPRVVRVDDGRAVGGGIAEPFGGPEGFAGLLIERSQTGIRSARGTDDALAIHQQGFRERVHDVGTAEPLQNIHAPALRAGGCRDSTSPSPEII